MHTTAAFWSTAATTARAWNDLGPLLTDGGYNGTLTTSSDNPLKGRNAFVRESNGYKSSRANLTSLAGQSVRIRFPDQDKLYRQTNYGWFIDDIRIYTCGPMLAPTAATQAASNVTTSGATLNGMVDPNGTATSYQFEFGTTAAYGSVRPRRPGERRRRQRPDCGDADHRRAGSSDHVPLSRRGSPRGNAGQRRPTRRSQLLVRHRHCRPVLPPGCTIAGTAGNDVLVGTGRRTTSSAAWAEATRSGASAEATL